MWHWRAVFLLWLVLAPLGGWGARLDVGAAGPESVSLATYLEVLEDPEGQLTLADVQAPDIATRFQPDARPRSAINKGFNRSTWWMRLTVRNTDTQQVSRLLELGYPLLSHIDLYREGRTALSTGAATPFATRPYASRTYVFPLTLAARATETMYLRVQTSSAMLVPAVLWEPQAFFRKERSDYVAQAVFYGLAVAMIVYNLLLWSVLRDRTFLYYGVFATLGALAIAASNGWGHEFLWPDAAPWWSNSAVSILGSLTLAALLLFMRRMLDTRQSAPKLDRLVRGFVGLQLVFPVGAALWPHAFAVPGNVLTSATCVLTLTTGLYCWLVRRQHLAAFFVLAMGFWQGGVLLVGLKTLTLLPANVVTMNGYQIGMSLEMLSLAFALAWRFHMIRARATAAVRQANTSLAQRLQEREAELTASHQRLREVERRQTLAEERQRIMQDMHDGMGASLSSALWSVERGRLDRTGLTDVLKGCIDDLKLAIDSMEPVESDLLLLLATLRYRLGPRLESTGIALLWEVRDVPALPWLDPKAALHILRIAQEALANTIQHAEATEVRVSTGSDTASITVEIADNGRGFDAATVLTRAARSASAGVGKGLSNQLRRAKAIGAELHWTSDPSGTRMTLRLPLVQP